MSEATWEQLKDPLCSSARLRVPGGWIVRSSGNTTHQIFVADANHEWQAQIAGQKERVVQVTTHGDEATTKAMVQGMRRAQGRCEMCGGELHAESTQACDFTFQPQTC